MFVAVWFANSPWAILCNPTHATLIHRESIEVLPEQKGRNDETVSRLRTLFDATPVCLRRVLDESFYNRLFFAR